MIFLSELNKMATEGVNYNLLTQRAFQVILISTISLLTCQLMKFLLNLIISKKPKWFLLGSTGGFPSSHTGFCVALCLSLGMLQYHDVGGLDWSFAVAFALSTITIYDAGGIRYEAGKHAKILNNLTSDLTEEEKIELGFDEGENLKEMLGHKGFEILGGAVVGGLIGLIGYFICVNII